MASNDPVLLKEKKPVVEKKVGVDTKPQQIDMPKYMKDDFVGTICKNFDMSIDALMALCKKLKDRNGKYCEKMGLDVNLFILAALVKGEHGTKTFFSSGAKWANDSKLNEAKQLYDHYKTLKSEDGSRTPRDDLIGGDLSKSLEQRSGEHENVDTDMALAFITMWNNSRAPFRRKFTSAAEAAKWFGGCVTTNPDFFSEFPGGIAGITLDTYNNLANPKDGGNLNIHKEIMNITKGALVAAQLQENKVIPEVDQDILMTRLKELADKAMTEAEKRMIARAKEYSKQMMGNIALIPVPEPKPTQVQTKEKYNEPGEDPALMAPKVVVAPVQTDSSSYAGPKVQSAQPTQQTQMQSSYQELGDRLKASQKDLGITDEQYLNIKKGLELIQGLDSNGEILGLLNRLDPQKQANKLAYIGKRYGSGEEKLGADRAQYIITN